MLDQEFDAKHAEAVAKEIHARRYATDSLDQAGLSSRKLLQNTADKTTVEDWHELSAIIQTLPEAQREVIYLWRDISDEFARGNRCSVCGRTPKQNRQIGYDCVREC